MMKLAAIASLAVSSVIAFTPSASTVGRRADSTTTTSRITSPVLSLSPTDVDLSNLPIEEMESARAAFVLCFFGAAGSASLGREVIPKTYNQYVSTQALIGKGPAGSGGEEMGIFGYPETVYETDVIKILNNNMTAFDIVENYPGKYPGYLQFDSLAEANGDVSPMAARLVFDSLSLGINKNQILPEKAEQMLRYYQNNMDVMKDNLKKGKALGVSAFVILLGLIGTADYFALYHLLKGWFPLWQGFEDLPSSLLDDRGFGSLPLYFVNNIPDIPTDSFPTM